MLDPLDIGSFGMQTVVLNPEGVAHLIEQFGRLGRKGVFLNQNRVCVISSVL